MPRSRSRLQSLSLELSSVLSTALNLGPRSEPWSICLIKHGSAAAQDCWAPPVMALPTALGALVATGVLVSGLWTIVDLNSTVAQNREGAVRALLLAESGAAHAQGLLRGALVESSLNRCGFRLARAPAGLL